MKTTYVLRKNKRKFLLMRKFLKSLNILIGITAAMMIYGLVGSLELDRIPIDKALYGIIGCFFMIGVSATIHYEYFKKLGPVIYLEEDKLDVPKVRMSNMQKKKKMLCR